jgi:hypothetical protein
MIIFEIGSENGRVVTIEVWGLSMHLYFRRDGVSCRLWRAPLKSWIQPLPDSSNNNKKSRGHEYQSSKECEYYQIIAKQQEIPEMRILYGKYNRITDMHFLIQ